MAVFIPMRSTHWWSRLDWQPHPRAGPVLSPLKVDDLSMATVHTNVAPTSVQWGTSAWNRKRSPSPGSLSSNSTASKCWPRKASEKKNLMVLTALSQPGRKNEADHRKTAGRDEREVSSFCCSLCQMGHPGLRETWFGAKPWVTVFLRHPLPPCAEDLQRPGHHGCKFCPEPSFSFQPLETS